MKDKNLKNSIGLVRPQKFVLPSPENIILDGGKSLSYVEVAYEVYGEFNEDRTNAILIVHALSGDAHAAGYYSLDDRKPGWWDNMIGPGKCFDTRKYCIICSNILGGCKGTTGSISQDPQIHSIVLFYIFFIKQFLSKFNQKLVSDEQLILLFVRFYLRAQEFEF